MEASFRRLRSQIDPIPCVVSVVSVALPESDSPQQQQQRSAGRAARQLDGLVSHDKTWLHLPLQV